MGRKKNRKRIPSTKLPKIPEDIPEWESFCANEMLTLLDINPPPDKQVWATASGTHSPISEHVFGIDYALRDPGDPAGPYNGYSYQYFRQSEGIVELSKQLKPKEWHSGRNVMEHFEPRITSDDQSIFLEKRLIAILRNRKDQLEHLSYDRHEDRCHQLNERIVDEDGH